MPPAGFEPTVPSSERPQTQTLDRAVTGTCNSTSLVANNPSIVYRTFGDTNSNVNYNKNRQIIFGKEVNGNSDAPSEQVEQNFNQEYQLHCSVELVTSVFRVEDRGNTYFQKLDTFFQSTRRQFPVDVIVAIT